MWVHFPALTITKTNGEQRYGYVNGLVLVPGWEVAWRYGMEKQNPARMMTLPAFVVNRLPFTAKVGYAPITRNICAP